MQIEIGYEGKNLEKAQKLLMLNVQSSFLNASLDGSWKKGKKTIFLVHLGEEQVDEIELELLCLSLTNRDGFTIEKK